MRFIVYPSRLRQNERKHKMLVEVTPNDSTLLKLRSDPSDSSGSIMSEEYAIIGSRVSSYRRDLSPAASKGYLSESYL